MLRVRRASARARDRLVSLGAILSGILCSLAFAPVDASFAVFVGLGGFTLVLNSATVATGSKWRAAFVGFLFGLGFMGALLWWLNVVGVAAYVVLVIAQASFFAPMAIAMRAARRLPFWPAWLAAIWVAFESLRSMIPFGGFPWGRAAYAITDTPLEAYARLLGVPGTSAVVFFVSALAVACIQSEEHRRVGLFVAIVGIFAVGSMLPLGVAGPNSIKRVAVVQGGVPAVFEAWPRGEIFAMHLRQTDRLVDAVQSGMEERPDFVLWPEGGTDVDPLANSEAAARLQQVSGRLGAPILVGAILDGPTPQTAYNAGIVWSETGSGDRYIKRKVVPFGEFVPFRQELGDLVPRFDREIPRDMLPGTESGAINIAGTNVGDTICWDIAYDGIVREAVEDGAQMLVVQTSNANFTGTAQREQQWQISRMRAIETGRYVVVPSTNGISGVVNANGDEVAKHSRQAPATITADIQLGYELTPGVRFGGWIELLLGGAAVAGVALGFRRGRSVFLQVKRAGMKSQGRAHIN